MNLTDIFEDDDPISHFNPEVTQALKTARNQAPWAGDDLAAFVELVTKQQNSQDTQIDSQYGVNDTQDNVITKNSKENDVQFSDIHKLDDRISDLEKAKGPTLEDAGLILRKTMQEVKELSEDVSSDKATYTSKLSSLLQQYKQLQVTGAGRQELDPFMHEIKKLRKLISTPKQTNQDQPYDMRNIPTHTLEARHQRADRLIKEAYTLIKEAKALTEAQASFAIDNLDEPSNNSIDFTPSNKKYDVVNPEITREKKKSKQEIIQMLSKLKHVYQNIVNSYRGSSDPMAKRADAQRAKQLKMAINRLKSQLMDME